MEANAGIFLVLHLIGIILLEYISNASGSPVLHPGTCVTTHEGNCSRYKMCTEDFDNIVYPGKIKTLVLNLYFPVGLTRNVLIDLMTPDMSIILSDAHVVFNENTLSMTKGEYQPAFNEKSEKIALFSTNAEYDFGDIECNGTQHIADVLSTFSSVLDANDSCACCLVQLLVNYLMANISDVTNNSSRNITATLVVENELLEFNLPLVMNTTNKSNFTTDIADVVEFASSSLKTFQMRVVFPNPLSAYKLVLNSTDEALRIVSAHVTSVGEHFQGLINRTYCHTLVTEKYCAGEYKTRIIQFGYVPNKGAYDNDSSISADTIDFEVILEMSFMAKVGEVYALYISLEVDFEVTRNDTKYFYATEINPIERLDVTTNQTKTSLPKSGSGEVSFTWEIPPLSIGWYGISWSTKKKTGPGGDGMVVAATQIYKNVKKPTNLPCIIWHTYWKNEKRAQQYVANVPINKSIPSTNRFGFRIVVVVIPEIAGAGSIHELTVNLTYPGEGSPLLFRLDFSISDQEIFTTPDIHGKIHMTNSLQEVCQSVTSSTNVSYILETESHHDYGRLLVEIPDSAKSFVMCDFWISSQGLDVFANIHTKITKRDDGMLEKALVTLSPLNNVYLVTFFKEKDHSIKMNMTVTVSDDGRNVSELPATFKAKVISNNQVIWTGDLPLALAKPKIEVFPDFIVLTEIKKPTDDNITRNIWYHYSQNGSYYHREALKWENGSNVFAFPKVIAYYYFKASPCTVICNVKLVWLPLKDYVTIVNDVKNVMLRRIPYSLDQNMNTCFDLPVPGDSPSMFWMNIKNLTLFGVTSRKFVVHVTGDRIECKGIGQKNIQVGASRPATNDQCNIESDITFCKLMSQSTNFDRTRCDIQCECSTLSACSNVHILMQSVNTDPWRLCEISIQDVK